MSLINDALRRARQNPPKTSATADGPAFRAADPPASSGTGSLLTLPFLIALVLVLAGAMFWAWTNSQHTSDIKVRANPRMPAVNPTPPPPPVTLPVASGPLPAGARPGDNATNSFSTNAAAGGATTSNLTATQPAAPTTYKLQGIFYARTNPSALINDKTVFVGSRVDDAKVIRIELDSVTIQTISGETRILDLR